MTSSQRLSGPGDRDPDGRGVEDGAHPGLLLAGRGRLPSSSPSSSIGRLLHVVSDASTMSPVRGPRGILLRPGSRSKGPPPSKGDGPVAAPGSAGDGDVASRSVAPHHARVRLPLLDERGDVAARLRPGRDLHAHEPPGGVLPRRVVVEDHRDDRAVRRLGQVPLHLGDGRPGGLEIRHQRHGPARHVDPHELAVRRPVEERSGPGGERLRRRDVGEAGDERGHDRRRPAQAGVGDALVDLEDRALVGVRHLGRGEVHRVIRRGVGGAVDDAVGVARRGRGRAEDERLGVDRAGVGAHAAERDVREVVRERGDAALPERQVDRRRLAPGRDVGIDRRVVPGLLLLEQRREHARGQVQSRDDPVVQRGDVE